MTPEQILAELATLARQLEEYAAAVWMLNRRRDELCAELRAAGWQSKPPATVAVPGAA